MAIKQLLLIYYTKCVLFCICVAACAPDNFSTFHSHSDAGVISISEKHTAKSICHDITCHTHTHTHTHTQLFNDPLFGTIQVSRYQKGKTNLDFTKARDNEWQRHQLGHMQVCTSLQTDNHASTRPLSSLQAGCPSCRPTNSVKALKAT